MHDAADDVVLPLPPSAPRVEDNPFARWLGRTILRLGGWRMEGEFPDLPRLVLIGAPHSSNWDGLWGLAAFIEAGLHAPTPRVATRPTRASKQRRLDAKRERSTIKRGRTGRHWD